MERFVAADRLSLPDGFHHLRDHGHRVDVTRAFYTAAAPGQFPSASRQLWLGGWHHTLAPFKLKRDQI
jgi:hypothetical protein